MMQFPPVGGCWKLNLSGMRTPAVSLSTQICHTLKTEREQGRKYDNCDFCLLTENLRLAAAWKLLLSNNTSSRFDSQTT